MSDPYLYPGTDVLVNLAAIRNRGALEQCERVMTLQRVREGLPPIAISADGFRTLHHHLFQDVYASAGRDRTVELAKGDSVFCRAAFIARELDERFAAVQADRALAGSVPADFAAGAAAHLTELNAIHPFREGNGRALRALLQVLGERASLRVDLTRIAPDAWRDASIRGFMHAGHAPMQAVIAGALS